MADSTTKDELLKVVTRNYRPVVFGAPSALWNLSATMGFTLSQVEAMCRDSQVKLCLRFLVTPLLTAEFEKVEATDQQVGAFVTRQYRRFWQRSLPVALEMYRYGCSFAEVLYKEDDDGALEFNDLKYLARRDAAMYSIEGTPAFIRLRTGGGALGDYGGGDGDRGIVEPLWLAEEGKPAKGFWTVHDPLFDPFYGRSVLMAAWLPWRLKNLPTGGAMDAIAKWYYRHAYRGYIGRHPNAIYQDQAGDTPTDAQSLMRQMLDSLKTGADVILDNSRDDKGEYQWDIESYGEVNGDAATMTEYVAFLDQQIQRGIGIPDGIVTDSQGQGYAGRKIPEDAFYASAELDFNHTVEQFDEQVCRPLVKLKFGKSADYAVKPKPLLPIRQQAAQQAQEGQPGAEGQPQPGGDEEAAQTALAAPAGEDGTRPGGASALGHNRLSDDDEGVYHGQEAPGQGWVEIKPGPRGGKRWRRKETPQTGEPDSSPKGDSSPKQPLARKLLQSAQAVKTTARDAAARVGNAVWNKLSPPLQARLTRTWKLARAVEHHVMLGFTKARQLAEQAARERQLPASSVERLGRVLATADLVMAWTVNFPAVTAATGNPLLGKAASWVPAASLAYIAFSTAKNPFATSRAAWKVLAGKVAEAHASFGLAADGGSALSLAVAERLAERWQTHAGDDWYLALLYAALDQTRDLAKAIDRADAAYQEQPEEPGAVRLSAGGDVRARLFRAGKELAAHTDPAPMPGYGQIFLNDADTDGQVARVWYVGGDGDEDGFGKVVEYAIRAAYPAVGEIVYEAEAFPPKDEPGWRQVYPKSKDWSGRLSSRRLDSSAGRSGSDPLQRYQGKRGGKGWKNNQTGEVVYQEDKPGAAETIQSPSKPTTRAPSPPAPPSTAKPRASRGDMSTARREGKGKDARVVLADGSPAPAHIKPSMVPPDWRDVKVSLDPQADVLVQARDKKGNPKTVYSDAWNMKAAAAKFSRIHDALNEMPAMRQQVQQDRHDPKLAGVADCTWLMMEQGTRPGSEADNKGVAALFGHSLTAKDVTVGQPDKQGVPAVTLRITGHDVPIRDKKARAEIARRVESGQPLDDSTYWLKSHGATTLEGRHVVQAADGVRLRFMGKESVWHDHLVHDPDLAAMLLARKQAAGAHGKLFGVSDGQVSAYAKKLDGGGFSPKDWRTSRATRLALEEISKQEPPRDDKGYKGAVMAVAKKVSGVLGNEPAQALESYISPAVFASWRVAAGV